MSLVNVESNTAIEEKNDCGLDEDTDQANRIYEFTAIPSFVAVITFSLNKSVYIIKVTEKVRATQMMSDMYEHRISKGEFNLRGNYLKVVRSKNMLLKKFEILNFEVLIPPHEVFEIFVEVADDLTMSCRSYLALKERAKWAFSLILVHTYIRFHVIQLIFCSLI